ncbi:thioredoxin domain-containing protein [Breoghania sp.]|uniref:thioredoxin domain-containing protein n=1 Tax=Breoghania sp. TaxID=2065378 RepID=UPI002AA67409|nr:thioredoxin domain-containing protein [Breoghania sp.]
MATNHLANETSPYLLQHKDNPVHWRPWNAAALAEARETGKPILLSVGYAACHWCHVMAHESFEDESVAEAINAHFIPIKVDREERPDIDQIYMNALHALGQQGGWPLTMFLTPKAEPFWGGTYFPKESRWGRPGFIDILTQIARIHEKEPKKVSSNASALMEILQKTSACDPSPHTLSPTLFEKAAERLLSVMDPVNGGTKGAPKFPQGPLLDLLWRAGRQRHDPRYRQAVLTTLEQICSGGIYDHIGGGFARYAVDEIWLVPHFEKMLYDNAQLVSLLSEAFVATGNDLFRIRIEETVDWLAREMRTEEGAFCASLDADSEGEEGRFYVWQADEIENLLGPADFPIFAETYDVTPGGNWEGKVILNRLRSQPLADRESEVKLAGMRAKLLQAREDRIRPGLDDKVLADWNGLMIAALARASEVFGRNDWLDLARDAFRFITESMASNGRLAHSWRATRMSLPAQASDYANMIRAALTLHRATGENAYLAKAREWEATFTSHYWDRDDGGYFLTADDADDLIIRPRNAIDDATPNANGIMASNLVELWQLTGEPNYRDQADAILKAFTSQVLQNAFSGASLLSAFDSRIHARQLVLIEGDGGDDPFAGLMSRVESGNLSVIRRAADAPPLPAGHPANGKTALKPGEATAYLCEGQTCSAPLTDAESLLAALRKPV